MTRRPATWIAADIPEPPLSRPHCPSTSTRWGEASWSKRKTNVDRFDWRPVPLQPLAHPRRTVGFWRTLIRHRAISFPRLPRVRENVANLALMLVEPAYDELDPTIDSLNMFLSTLARSEFMAKVALRLIRLIYSALMPSIRIQILMDWSLLLEALIDWD